MFNLRHLTNLSSRRFRLRTTLVVPFVLQIVAAVGLVGYLSFRNGQKAVNDLATQLRNEVIARVHDRVQTYVETPPLVNQVNAHAIELGLIDFQKMREAQPYFWRQVLSYEAIGYVGFANKQGQYSRVGWINRLSKSEHPQIAEQLTPGGGNLNYYDVDSNGNRTKLAITSTNYDPRNRPYYTAAVEKKKPTWSPIYVNVANPTLQINASQPYYDPNGKLIGILTCQMGLNQIRSFLQTLKIGRSGQVLIIEPTGELVATSINNQPLWVGEPKNLKRIRASESDNLLMRSSATFLSDHFDGLKNIQQDYQFDFMLKGQRQFIQVSPFTDNHGLDWLIVVAVPELDFMEQINANNRTTLLLCLAALIVAIGMGIITSRWITYPILRVTQASEDMASGNLNQYVEARGIIELEKLAGSFNSMATQLKDSFEALRIAEENYRSIFENALEGIFQASPDGHFISVNPAMARIYAYDSPEDMIASVTNIETQLYVAPKDGNEFQRLMAKYGQAKDFEYQTYQKDGTIIWIQSDARAVRDTNGKLLYYEGIVQDISLRKRQEEELKRQLQELQIEIDYQKREREVAKITQSDYFQEIQAEIESLNPDQFWG